MIEDRGAAPPELPDVWDGADLEETAMGTAEEAGDAGLGAIYAERPPEPAVAEARPVAPVREPEEPESLALAVTSHVVVPLATIVMVSALLFFLYDVRAVFLPGSMALKWIGVCFVSATVLIARYARLAGEMGSAGCYSGMLAAATLLTLWASPWDAPDAGVFGALSNGVIILIVWRYASSLTERLSADLDAPPRPPPRLYGLERLEMAAARQRAAGNGETPWSIDDVKPRARRRDRRRADGAAASRQIGVLVLAALGGVAAAEPLLLAGAPALAVRALGALVVFLFAAGVVLAAAASIRDQQRLRSLGSRPGAGGLTARLALAAALVAAVLVSGLALPGFEPPRGSGLIVQRGADDRSIVGSERGEADRRQGEDASSEPSPDDTAEAEADPVGQGAAGGSWLDGLVAVGRWLRWPVLGAVAVATLAALRKLGPGWLATLRRAWLDLLSRRRRRGGRGKTSRRRARAALVLDGLAPRQAVLAAYGFWLDLCAELGHVRAARHTPLEFLAALPRELGELRPAGERLTRLYIAAAYGDRAIDDRAVAAARGAATELAQIATRRPAD